jgi:hypothetical protein
MPARAWFRTRRWVLRLGPLSLLLVLASGVYAITTALLPRACPFSSSFRASTAFSRW